MNWPDMIRAIATLSWPVGLTTAVIVFRKQLRETPQWLASLRLKIGQNEAEIKLREKLEELQQTALQGETQVAETSTPPTEPLQGSEGNTSEEEAAGTANQFIVTDVERAIISLAASSPKVALIELSRELERYTAQLHGRSKISDLVRGS